MNQIGDARSGKLAENLLGFARTLRRAGISVSSERISLSLKALTIMSVGKREDVKSALQTIFINREQDLEVFHQLFESYFRNPNLANKLLAQMLPQAQEAAVPRQRKARAQEALQAVRAARTPAQKLKDEELKLDAAMSASERHRLQNADFQSLSASEFVLVQQLAREIALPLPKFKSRRYQSHGHGPIFHWAKVMRNFARHGGELLNFEQLKKRYQSLPLLILVDVSGSMERYARLMLAFLHQATQGTPRAVFAFGTKLSDLRFAFKQHDVDCMLMETNKAVSDFAGGTCLGDSLAQLRNGHRNLLIGRRTVMVLISDGLDTGKQDLLEHEISWIKQHVRNLLWLNPLLRFDEYAPLASGAQVLHKHADGMLAIHNLSNLQDLARAMSKLLKN